LRLPGSGDKAARVQLDHLGAPGARILDIAPDTPVMTIVHHSAVIAVAHQARVHPPEHGAEGVDELIDPRLRAQHVIGRDAGLTRIERLAEADPLRGQVHGDVLGDQGRRLAAQLQRHRRQVGRRRAHDMPADFRAAREQQVIERQARELYRALRLAEHDRHLALLEGLGKHVAHQLGRARRALRHLDQDAVARREREHQRARGKRDRVVPRRDDADDAERLEVDHRLGGRHQQAGAAPLRLHPALQAPQAVIDVVDDDQDLRHRLRAGAAAEIRRERDDEAFAVGDQHLLEALQVGPPGREVRHRRGHEGRALGIEQPPHPGDLVLFGDVGRLCGHETLLHSGPVYEM
jgi:hypothetical protein